MDEQNIYKEQIIANINTLVECDVKIFTSAINFYMNEQKEINDSFEVGANYKFEIEQLEDCSDQNLRLIVETVKKIKETINTLKNQNGIRNEEIKWL